MLDNLRAILPPPPVPLPLALAAGRNRSTSRRACPQDG
jgi:hypothetical protein